MYNKKFLYKESKCIGYSNMLLKVMYRGLKKFRKFIPTYLPGVIQSKKNSLFNRILQPLLNIFYFFSFLFCHLYLF